MSTFRPFGPLAPKHNLFRGRNNELTTLARLCQGEVEAYAIVYGGRQMGKTSLMLHLPGHLPPGVTTCRVDFQACSGFDTASVCRHLAKNIAGSLLGSPPVAGVGSSPDLIQFVAETIVESKCHRLVLLLEELGALPTTTRHDLANILRAMFNARFDFSTRGLARVMVILAGSIELYDLAATQVSTLHNVCVSIYLSDLNKAEAVGLISDGLTTLGLTASEAAPLAAETYAQVGGHPYLTQRLGYAIEQALSQGDQLSVAIVQSAAQDIMGADTLMMHHRKGLRENNLFDACHCLLEGQTRASRLDEEMAKLELLGLARQQNGRWVVRNALFEQALRSWLNIPPSGSNEDGALNGVTLGRQGRLSREHQELEQRFERLTTRIANLDTDIGRETEEFRKCPLVERRDDLEAERAVVSKQLGEIELKIAGIKQTPDP